MVSIAPRHVFVPSPQLMVAFTGLEGDVQSLSQELSKQVASKLGRGLGFMNENRQHRIALMGFMRTHWHAPMQHDDTTHVM